MTGIVRFFGVVQPKSGPLVLGFPAGRLQMFASTLDGSVQQIRNVGVLPLANQTVVGDARAGLGLINLAGGQVSQSGQVALADQAAVVNEGLWVMANSSADIVTAASGGAVERFVNTGTLRSTASVNDDRFGVVMEPAGTVDVQGGT